MTTIFFDLSVVEGPLPWGQSFHFDAMTISDLPQLTGSARQIKFASDIRHSAMINLRYIVTASIKANVNISKREIDIYKQQDAIECTNQCIKDLDVIAKKLDTRIESDWWIKNKEGLQSLSTVITTIIKP